MLGDKKKKVAWIIIPDKDNVKEWGNCTDNYRLVFGGRRRPYIYSISGLYQELRSSLVDDMIKLSRKREYRCFADFNGWLEEGILEDDFFSVMVRNTSRPIE